MPEGRSERPTIHGRSFAGRGKGARREETVGQRIVHIVFTPHFCYAVGEDNALHLQIISNLSNSRHHQPQRR